MIANYSTGREAPIRRPTASEPKRPSYFDLAILFALMVFLTFVGVYSLATTNIAFHQARNAASQISSYNADFAEVMAGNIEAERAVLAEARKHLDQLVTIVKQGAVAQQKFDEVIGTINQTYIALQGVSQLNKDSENSIANWKQATQSVVVRQSRLDVSIVSTADAKEWTAPPKKPSKVDTPSQAAADTKHDKMDRLLPFLWAFILIPSAFGFGGFACLFSPTPKVRDFGMTTVTATLGYLAGLGAGGFAIGLA